MAYNPMFSSLQQQMLTLSSQNSFYNSLPFQNFPLMPSNNNNIQNLLCFPPPNMNMNVKQPNIFDMKAMSQELTQSKINNRVYENISSTGKGLTERQVKVEESCINQKSSPTSNGSEYHPSLEEISKERREYSEFFGKMYDELFENWNKQLEFIKCLRDMNQPENAMSFPMMDKVNPVIAGVLNKTSKISENTLKVMQRTHKLIKSKDARDEPLRRHNDVMKRAKVSDINVKREFEDKEQQIDKKRKQIKMAQEKENKIAIEQVIKFIVDGDDENAAC